MYKLKDILDKIIGRISIVIMMVMVSLTLWQVFARYVLNNPSSFSEVLTRYLFVWLVTITATYVFGQKEHMAITFFKEKLPENVKRIIDVVIEVITIGFASTVMVYGGSVITKMQMSQTDATLNIQSGYIYSVIPICGIIIIMYSIINIIGSGKNAEEQCVTGGNE